MQIQELEDFLHRSVPITRALQLRVHSAAADALILSAPLGPNINQHDTVFGGSAAMVGVLAAWALVHKRMHDEGLRGKLVVRSSRIDYMQPMTKDFQARAVWLKDDDWSRFCQDFAERGKAKITVQSSLSDGGETAAVLTGTFVLLTQ